MKPDGSIFRSRPVPTSEQSLRIAFEGFDEELVVHPRLDINGCGALKDVSRKAFDAAMRCEKDNSFKLRL